MKKISKLVSVLILTLMLSITAFAALTGDPISIQVGSQEQAMKTTSTLITRPGVNACNSNVGFSARKTLRMSLVKLDQPFNFELESEVFTYAKAVQRYGSSYYVTCPEEALYYPVSGDNPTRTYRDKPVVLFSGDNIAKFPKCGAVFVSIMNDMADNDVVKTSPINGAKYITPEADTLNQLVTELSQLGGYNYQLAQEYLNSQSNDELAKTPIAVCIEVVAPVIGEGDPYFASAADMCYRIGGENAYRALLSSNFFKLGGNFDVHAEAQRRKGTPQEAAATDIAIAKLCGYYDGDVNADSWPLRFTKRFFGTMWKSNGKMYNGWRKHLTDVFSVWAWDAWQTYSDRATGINGCTLVALEPTDVWPGNLGNGLTNGRPADDPQTHPAGKYTWHIDAEGASVTASGHREDQTVKVRGAASGSVSKTNVVGALSLNQTNSYEWQNWLTQIGATSIDVEVHRYHLGQGNFTTERSAILGSGSAATGNGITNSSESAVITFTLDCFLYLFSYSK